MKKIIAWPLAWLFWGLGRLVVWRAYPLWGEPFTRRWHLFDGAFNRLMRASSRTQNWADAKDDLDGPWWPWGKYYVKDDDV